MLLFLKTYWKAIAIVLLLVLTNVATYQRTSSHVNTAWELKWSEANVEALKSTIEEQNREIEKQQQLIKEKTKNEQYHKQEQAKLDVAFTELSTEHELLLKTLDSMSEGGEDGSAGVNRERASEATTSIVRAELLRWSVQANEILSKEADSLRLSNTTCINEYNSVKRVINGEK
jgi:septal ring factor EnvC (AmiA/AmiB activator)